MRFGPERIKLFSPVLVHGLTIGALQDSRVAHSCAVHVGYPHSWFMALLVGTDATHCHCFSLLHLVGHQIPHTTRETAVEILFHYPIGNNGFGSWLAVRDNPLSAKT